MRKRIHSFPILLFSAAASLALGQVSTSGEIANVRGPLERMPAALEIKFALSALPPALREQASVYVLDPARGYVLQRAGNNGQSCFVGRTEWKFADYRNDVFDPICYDAVGAQNHMRVWFDVAELRAKGIDADTMKKKIEAAFRTGIYKAPDHAGMSYMTAPLMRSYMSLDPKDKESVMTMSMPHVMHYAPNVTAAGVGGQQCPPCAPYPFVFEPGPHGYVIQRLGDAESSKIVADEAVLVGELCSYRKALCLAPRVSGHSD